MKVIVADRIGFIFATYSINQSIIKNMYWIICRK